MFKRKITRTVKVGGIPIGGGSPVVIQSMTNTGAHDVEGTLLQVGRLGDAGCSIVRLAVPDMEAVGAFKSVKNQTKVPLVADIHFDYRLAIAAIEAGADKIRINPGNIGGEDRVRAVINAARGAGVPIRIGVNSGSLEKHLLDKYGSPCAAALAESAVSWISFFERENFGDIVVSIKASDVLTTIEACRALSARTDVPQHIGITESGTVRSGSVRSAVGLGALLADGIGDTLRVSLSGDPVQEIYVAKEILKSLELMEGPSVIACPTCGRTQVDVAGVAEKVEELVSGMEGGIRVAVMGCVVNGPGEAREADVGIAGGKGEWLIFVKGEPKRKVLGADVLEELKREIAALSPK
ncbi:MAG: flavodoxin-dependent (E)-4-hydroxy-3-methylbut-2-enyl-diphosphate synthase [Chitinispirillia bacterium]|nr:flavodoxin-dependent (E)-4-hydroxy-3-methylbut-2-enyl-diphosphate synthase [Chitinispirillia bacterium]MCL2269442.1 flavodoxin-dependent (E)-4-hydroxy-3-methylbut-2-enyl-diphosphate synthase [Chitinispirillia bacterium]